VPPSSIGRAGIPALRVHPQPAYGSVRLELAPGRTGGVCEIRDLLGRHVKTLRLVGHGGVSGETAGTSIEWDGRAESGARVPAGVYLIRLAGGSTEPVRLLYLR
jgi:hypothetical protein